MENKLKTTIDLLMTYLQEKQLTVYSDSTYRLSYGIRKPKPKDESGNKEYWAQRFLEADFSSTNDFDQFFNFVQYLITKDHPKEALQQLIAKTPTPSQYDYDTTILQIIERFKPFQPVLLAYVGRTKFMEKNWQKIPTIFNIIDSQVHRLEIVEKVFDTKTFQALDTQAQVYQMVQKYIKLPDRLNHRFTKLKIGQEERDVVGEIKSCSVSTMHFSMQDLMAANLNRVNISSGDLSSFLEKGFKQIVDSCGKSLQVERFNYQKSSQDHVLDVFCHPENLALIQKIFKDFINCMARLSSEAEIRQQITAQGISQLVSKVSHDFLQDRLTPQQQRSGGPRKI